jgi:phosphoglycolate phosphatase/pyrophosphatase PpaX
MTAMGLRSDRGNDWRYTRRTKAILAAVAGTKYTDHTSRKFLADRGKGLVCREKLCYNGRNLLKGVDWMRYKCLVLDHDDTVVRSTAEIHFPSFRRVLAELRPEVNWTLEEYLRLNYDPGFLTLVRDVLHFTDEELAYEEAVWRADVAETVPAAFPEMGPLLRCFRAQGGRICVVSHSFRDNILRDYRENGLPEPDLVFGWELPRDKVKPAPYALETIMTTYGYSPRDLLMVDDLKPGYEMARTCHVDFLAAGWAYNIPEIAAEFTKLGVPYLTEAAQLEGYLF